MPPRYDAIVVGAGLAGLSAAYTMARQGMSVVVIERGTAPGAKNVMGGVLYTRPTADVFPDFWRAAPVERPLVEVQYWAMSDAAATKICHHPHAWAEEPGHAYTVLRSQFDAWLGREVAAAGALIVPTTTVVDLLRDGPRVTGVRTNRPRGDLSAPLVILADGAISLLGETMGLHPRWRPAQLALAVKEILAPPGTRDERIAWISQRFGQAHQGGVAIDMFGALTQGMIGTAFLYTNTDTLSFGVGVLLSDLASFGHNPFTLLQAAKGHPALRPFLAECVTREYSAHLIPEGGYDAIPTLVGDGVMIVGDAAQLCNGLHREGSNFAMISGKLAGETAARAHAAGDFSARCLGRYAERLRQSFIMRDLRKYRHATRYMTRHRDILANYPALLNTMATTFLTVDNAAKWEKQRQLVGLIEHKGQFLADILGLIKVMK